MPIALVQWRYNHIWQLMETKNISNNFTNKQNCSQDQPKTGFLLPKRNPTTSLEDLFKKQIYSSYRSRTDKLETLGFHKKSNHDFDTCSEKQTNKRAVSVKASLKQRPSLKQTVIDKRSNHDYSQNLLKLKIEEMVFKFKTKIATILKQIDTPITQFNKFTSLTRIDDFLDFLAQMATNRLSNSEASRAQNTKALSKEKQLLKDYEQQFQLLKKKLIQKESIQKNYKAKLKQSHSQIRDLYDKINQKQRQLSQKMTQLYQLKSASKQSDKLFDSYKQKNLSLERELSEQKSKHGMEAKKVTNDFKHIEQQNKQLRQANEELIQMIEAQKLKQAKILEINQHLNEQLHRWKERLESGMSGQVESVIQSRETLKSNQNLQTNEANPLSGKLSSLTLENQVSRLNYKVKDLQKQNRNLSRESVNYACIKDKYDELLECISTAQRLQSQVNTEPSANISKKWKNMVGQQQLFQVQYFYKKKIEEIVKQWRDKLIEVISKAQEDQQSLKKELMRLEKANQELENKVYELANEKYVIENKLIEKEREVYELTKTKRVKRNSFYAHSAEHATKSEVLRSREGQTNNEES